MSKYIRLVCQSLSDSTTLSFGVRILRGLRGGSPTPWAIPLGTILFTLGLLAQNPRDPSDPKGFQGVPGRVQLPGPGGEEEQNGRKNLSGQVVDKQGKGLAQAVVHLKNKKTLDVKTFISNDEGNYRFNGLDANTDYAVHAEYQGAMSRDRSVSSFDDRKEVYLVLEIDTSK
ncbi:MAG: carboxypeptidase regulatory-like domain-containing protein [Acidobacteria bacterium]|nr:carboxypeptidase regulatory-like domain-containing protein [Acidobacteriota bacterium]